MRENLHTLRPILSIPFDGRKDVSNPHGKHNFPPFSNLPLIVFCFKLFQFTIKFRLLHAHNLRLYKIRSAVLFDLFRCDAAELNWMCAVTRGNVMHRLNAIVTVGLFAEDHRGAVDAGQT